MEDQKYKKINIFITGAAGYIGSLLIKELLKKDFIENIIALDREDLPQDIKSEKIKFIKANTVNEDWRREARAYNPDIVIHLAWQIREMWKEKKKQWKWNVDGSLNVFDFAFSMPSVKKLIYTSTASVYGAFSKNEIYQMFKEDDPMREKEYLYGFEKRVVEEKIKDLYESERKGGANIPDIYILRLGSLTGPVGRSREGKFGLMQALSKKLPKGVFYKIISWMVTFIPSPRKFCRQFVHEDDIIKAIMKTGLETKEKNGEYKVFNVAPHGEPVTSKDLAEILGRKRLPVIPIMIRIMFFIARHISRGKITATRGGWRFYCYPIALDGSKIERDIDFEYEYTPREALEGKIKS